MNSVVDRSQKTPTENHNHPATAAPIRFSEEIVVRTRDDSLCLHAFVSSMRERDKYSTVLYHPRLNPWRLLPPPLWLSPSLLLWYVFGSGCFCRSAQLFYSSTHLPSCPLLLNWRHTVAHGGPMLSPRRRTPVDPLLQLAACIGDAFGKRWGMLYAHDILLQARISIFRGYRNLHGMYLSE